MLSTAICFLSLIGGIDDAIDPTTGLADREFKLSPLGFAMLAYTDREGALPYNRFMGKDSKGNVKGLSWRVEILNKYGEYHGLYKKFHLDESWDGPHNKDLIKEIPDFLEMPAHGKADVTGKTCWLGLVGKDAAFLPDGGKRKYTPHNNGPLRAAIVISSKEVVWTQPVDLAVEDAKKGMGIRWFKIKYAHLKYPDLFTKNDPRAVLSSFVSPEGIEGGLAPGRRPIFRMDFKPEDAPLEFRLHNEFDW